MRHVTHSYAWHDSVVFLTWLVTMCHDICHGVVVTKENRWACSGMSYTVPVVILTCDMTHLYVRHHAILRETWLMSYTVQAVQGLGFRHIHPAHMHGYADGAAIHLPWNLSQTVAHSATPWLDSFWRQTKNIELKWISNNPWLTHQLVTVFNFSQIISKTFNFITFI